MTSARTREWLGILLGWVGFLLALLIIEGFIVYFAVTATYAAVNSLLLISAVLVLLPIWVITCEFIPDAWAEYRKGD